jgi:hypothetical protein
MARGDSKIDVRVIVRAHRASYIDVRTGRPRRRDNLLMEGAPGIALGLCLVFDFKLLPSAAVGLLTVSGLLSALFFGVMLQMSDRAMSWADAPPRPGPVASEHALYLEELAAHAGYASLICIAAAVSYVIASVGSGWTLRIATALGVAFGTHLVLVLLLIMKRVFLLTRERLNRARTNSAASSQKRAS